MSARGGSASGGKNIILGLIVIAVVVSGGYYLLSGDKTVTGVMEDGSGQASSLQAININQPDATSSGSLSPSPSATSEVKKSHMITIDTNYGKIVFETYDNDAPNTVKNFVTLADKGFYNGLTFHRVIKGFMLQGGDPTGNGTGGPGYQFADELNPNTPSYKAGYVKGVVAMANSGPNTNGSQFFIMTADYPLSNDYTIFGKVVSGQDVVDKIANLPTGANDKPLSPVIMKTVSAK